jgi:hypothetical protein
LQALVQGSELVEILGRGAIQAKRRAQRSLWTMARLGQSHARWSSSPALRSLSLSLSAQREFLDKRRAVTTVLVARFFNAILRKVSDAGISGLARPPALAPAKGQALLVRSLAPLSRIAGGEMSALLLCDLGKQEPSEEGLSPVAEQKLLSSATSKHTCRPSAEGGQHSHPS